MKVLVTGAAGFIGFHVSQWLCERGDSVVGLDNLNDYYDVALKKARLNRLNILPTFSFVKLDILNREILENIFGNERFDCVVHLAAQAGVRNSIENPHEYGDSNLVGFLNILENCRNHGIEHLVYASSSSVYGANKSIPFAESDSVDHPVSLYAATKKANEAMAHSYSHLYNLPTTGLRFFTVYGPWGRPDMSPVLFARAISNNEPLQIFNYGKHRRDFTFIDDIVKGVLLALDNVAKPDPGFSNLMPSADSSTAPWKIYNIGNGEPVELLHYIGCIEKELGKTAIKELLPMQQGDVQDTYADITALKRAVGYQPSTSVEVGVGHFVRWFREYYGNKN